MRRVICPLMVVFSLVGNLAGQGVVKYLPDPGLTPGDTLNISREDLCKADERPVGNVPVRLKSQVLERYGISPTATGFNVDRLIPVVLGGSNSIKNLWPQPLEGEWNYHMKNRLERRLKKMVCAGQMDLKEAQREIAIDWVSAYKKYILKTR